jgi:hypothetical protein
MAMARTAFKIGCYLAFFAAALHMVGAHIVPAFSPPPVPANDTERQLLDLTSNYKLALPGAMRSTKDLMDGFSLIFALMLALTGGLGLIVARRSANDPLLLVAAARALAAAYIVGVIISLEYFFLVPTICMGSIAVAFTIASLAPKGPAA